MKANNFFGKLHKLQACQADNAALVMTPHLARMPLPMQRYDDPFLPFGKAIVSATHDLVCAYVFDLPAYLEIGAAGAVALERTIAYCGSAVLVVLHGAFGGPAYAPAALALGADAVTLADGSVAAYEGAGLGVFRLEGGSLVLVGGELRLRLLGEDVLYAGHGDDFAERTRAALRAALK